MRRTLKIYLPAFLSSCDRHFPVATMVTRRIFELEHPRRRWQGEYEYHYRYTCFHSCASPLESPVTSGGMLQHSSNPECCALRMWVHPPCPPPHLDDPVGNRQPSRRNRASVSSASQGTAHACSEQLFRVPRSPHEVQPAGTFGWGTNGTSWLSRVCT